MKKKTMDLLAASAAVGCAAATSYFLMKNRKNMLDVIIEEIETIK